MKRNEIITLIIILIFGIEAAIGSIFFYQRNYWHQRYESMVEINQSYDKIVEERDQCLKGLQELTSK